MAALLRVATYRDHLFLLNHVLRAPAGVGRWASGFVQIPGPASLALQTTLGSPVLDHAVTCLATVLLPVRYCTAALSSAQLPAGFSLCFFKNY